MALPDITWQDVQNTAHDIADNLEDFTSAQQDLIVNMVNRRIPEPNISKIHSMRGDIMPRIGLTWPLLHQQAKEQDPVNPLALFLPV